LKKTDESKSTDSSSSDKKDKDSNENAALKDEVTMLKE